MVQWVTRIPQPCLRLDQSAADSESPAPDADPAEPPSPSSETQSPLRSGWAVRLELVSAPPSPPPKEKWTKENGKKGRVECACEKDGRPAVRVYELPEDAAAGLVPAAWGWQAGGQVSGVSEAGGCGSCRQEAWSGEGQALHAVGHQRDGCGAGVAVRGMWQEHLVGVSRGSPDTLGEGWSGRIGEPSVTVRAVQSQEGSA
jgi:hypothetical protein